LVYVSILGSDQLTRARWQIAESFRRFGVSDTTSTLLAIKVSNIPNAPADLPEPSTHLGGAVEGTRIDFCDASLKGTADLTRLRKIYKLNAGNRPSGTGKKGKTEKHLEQSNGVHEEIDEYKEMEAVILGVMALKGS
jgi:EKC/KEOPS complex subunit CGI121/TPRKB